MTNTYSAALNMEYQGERSTGFAPALHFARRRRQADSYDEVVSLQLRHPVLSVAALLLTGPALVLAVAGFAAAIVAPVAWLCGWL